MHPATTSLIAPTANPLLERALRDKLQRRGETAGSLGELEPLAVRIGLIQNTLKPRFRDPQLVLFASDNGLAVEGITAPPGHGTAERVWQALRDQLPASVFAAIQGMNLSVVDAGVAERLPPHERLLMRKIAPGTRNSRVGPAMTVEQAHAAIRAGMEIGQSLPGNVLACAGLGVGGHESAALILVVLSLLARSMAVDVPVVSNLLRAQYFLLVVQQGENRRDAPVDLYLWDLREDRQLLRTRIQARGVLIPVRIDRMLPGVDVQAAPGVPR